MEENKNNIDNNDVIERTQDNASESTRPKKSFGKGLLNFLLGLIAFVFLALAVVFGILFFHVRSLGKEVGKISGGMVGAAVGSINGATQGYNDGTEAGLSAEDIQAEIAMKIDDVGKLQVLAADVTLKNLHEIGDSYKGLYLIAGDAVFTVDLSKAEYKNEDERKLIQIVIPEPEIQLHVDETKTDLLADKLKFSLQVGMKDGVEGYLNSMANITEEVENNLTNYDLLMNSARESASKQVERLAKAVCADEYTVSVTFKEKEQ